MSKLTRFITGLLMISVASVAFAGTETAANKKVAAKVINEKLNDAEASAILQTPYDGYVEIRGKAKNSVFTFSKVKSKASFPDSRFEELARTIAGEVELVADEGSSSSKQKPSATAYVFFYKDGIEGVNTAGARQVNVTDGDADYMALLVIRQKGPRGGVTYQNEGNFNSVSRGGNKVYKFELDA